MTKYTEIIFQTNSLNFTSDHDLNASLAQAIQKPFQIERVNYDDGTWSGWYNLKSTILDLKNTAILLQGFPGLTSVMLKTDANTIEEPQATTPHYATGAQIGKPPAP